jgi:hypothetical protein
MDEYGQLSPLEEYALMKQMEAQKARGMYTDAAKASLEKPQRSWDQVAAQALLNIAPILIGAGIDGREGAYAGATAGFAGGQSYNQGIEEDQQRQSLLKQLEAQEAQSAFRSAEKDADWAMRETLKSQERDMAKYQPPSAFEAEQVTRALTDMGIKAPPIMTAEDLKAAKNVLAQEQQGLITQNRTLEVQKKQEKATEEANKKSFIEDLKGPSTPATPENPEEPQAPKKPEEIIETLMSKPEYHTKMDKKADAQSAEIKGTISQADGLLDEIERFHPNLVDKAYRADPLLAGKQAGDTPEALGGLNQGLRSMKEQLASANGEPGRLEKILGGIKATVFREAGKQTGTGGDALIAARAELLAKLLTKAIEGARPSDYDAVTYKAIVQGKVLSSPEMMYRFIAQTRNVMAASEIAKQTSFQLNAAGIRVAPQFVNDYARQVVARDIAEYQAAKEGTPPVQPQAAQPAQAQQPQEATNPIYAEAQKAAQQAGEPVIIRQRRIRLADGSEAQVDEMVAGDGTRLILKDGKTYTFDGKLYGS